MKFRRGIALAIFLAIVPLAVNGSTPATGSQAAGSSIVRSLEDLMFSQNLEAPSARDAGFGLNQKWMGAGPYASLNLAKGNLLTALPVFAFIPFTLYHNSASGNWSHDFNHRIVATRSTAELTTEDGAIIQFSFDGNRWVAEAGVRHQLIQSPNGGWVLITSDQARFVFSASGHLVSEIDSAGQTISISRDRGDRITSISDGSGRSLNLDYDGQGRLRGIEESFTITGEASTRRWEISYRDGQVQALSDPMGYSIQIPLYDNNSRILEIADKEENSTRYDYSSGRVVRVWDPAPLTTSSQYRYERNFLGNIRTVMIDRGSDETIFSFNDNGELVRIRDPFNNIRRYTWDQNRQLEKMIDTSAREMVFQYGPRGNLTRAIDEAGNSQRFEYDSLNNLVWEEDTMGNRTTYEHTSAHDPTALTKMMIPSGAGVAELVMTYRSSGLMKTFRDANGVETVFSYDSNENRNRTTEANSVATNLVLDQAGRPIRSWRDGIVTGPSQVSCVAKWVMTYNRNDQPVSQTLSCQNGLVTSTDYDRMGRAIGVTSTENDELGSSAVMQYDVLGRLLRSERTIIDRDLPQGSQVLVRVFEYQYNDANKSVIRTGPDGKQTHYQYDATYRLASVQRETAHGVMSALYQYNQDSQLESVQYGNGTSTQFAYDHLGQLRTLINADANRSIILSQSFGRNALGKITQIDELSPGNGVSQISLEYDSQGQLKRETRTGSHAFDLEYDYDLAGNRILKRDHLNNREMRHEYDVTLGGSGNATNRLIRTETFENGQSIELETYLYETRGMAAGNVKTIVRAGASGSTLTEVGHDVFAQVASVSQASIVGDANPVPTLLRNYSGFGLERTSTKKFNPNSPTQLQEFTLHDYSQEGLYGDTEINAQTGAASELAAIDLARGEARDQMTYSHTDFLGSKRVVTDANGSVLGEYVFTSFGERVHATLDSRYGFGGAMGYETDEALGIRTGHRHYSPRLGRYWARDPIGLRGDAEMSLYTYSLNDPISNADPLGTDAAAAAAGSVLVKTATGAGALAALDGPAPLLDIGSACLAVGGLIYAAEKYLCTPRWVKKSGKPTSSENTKEEREAKKKEGRKRRLKKELAKRRRHAAERRRRLAERDVADRAEERAAQRAAEQARENPWYSPR